jgi:hypothetical protein
MTDALNEMQIKVAHIESDIEYIKNTVDKIEKSLDNGLKERLAVGESKIMRMERIIYPLIAFILITIVGLAIKELMSKDISFAITWNHVQAEDLGGYKVYWGNKSRFYIKADTVGTDSLAVLTFPKKGTYYIAVTAYDTSGNESAYSNELVLDMEAPPIPENLRILTKMGE